MADELKYLEKSSINIFEMTLGAGLKEGGSRDKVFRVGNQSAMPFLFKEGEIPNVPIIAAEVCDIPEEDSPKALEKSLGKLLFNPVDLAKMMVDEIGADLVCLKLQGIHPDSGNKSTKEALDLTLSMLKKIKSPLIVLGCSHNNKDNETLPAISEATKGERLLFGCAVQENYKTLTAACIADGHNIIAESPIDVNIAKQLNILISDLGMPLDRIAINPTIGALGYGLEYAYSIMERARSAALSGDKMLAMPFICFVGQESWRAKEAKTSDSDFSQWGDSVERGIMWEALTAIAMVQAGADIITMRHPEAIKIVKKAIQDLIRINYQKEL